jgi:photosystem II stability/assembly factor-like uncharacterized protein
MGGDRAATVLAIALATVLAPAAGAIGTADAGATTDGESDWEQAPSPAGTAGWGIGGSSEAIVVSTISDGSFRSTDNGHTWEAVDAGIDEGEIAFDPTDPTRGYYAGFGGVARTTDAGATWEKVIDTDRSHDVAVHEDGTVLVSVQNDEFVTDLRVSEDDGETWTALDWPSESPLVEGLAFGSTSDDIVVLMLSDTWVSHDGGETWSHEDNGGRDLVSETDGTLWRAGSDGLERSTDDGDTWREVSSPANPDELAAHPEGGVYGATGEGVIVTTDGGQTWTNVGGEDVSWAATGLLADPQNPDAVLVSDENLGVSWIGPDGEGGYAFEGRTTGFPPVETFGLAASAEGSTLLAGTDLGIYQSADGGASWGHTGAGTGFGGIGTVAAGPSGSHLYAGDSNLVFQPIAIASSDGGQTFETVVLEGNDGRVTGIAVDPADPSHAWAAANIEMTDSKVYETTDGGQTWTKVLQIPVSVYDVAYDAEEEVLYAGTGVGVLASPTGGIAWAPAGGTGDVAAVDAEQGTVYAGNTAGDLWRSTALGPALAPWASPGSGVDEIDADPTSGSPAWVTFENDGLASCASETLAGACTDRTPPPGAVHEATVSPDGDRVLAATPSEGLWSLEPAAS